MLGVDEALNDHYTKYRMYILMRRIINVYSLSLSDHNSLVVAEIEVT